MHHALTELCLIVLYRAENKLIFNYTHEKLVQRYTAVKLYLLLLPILIHLNVKGIEMISEDCCQSMA